MIQKGCEFTHFGRNIEKISFFEGIELLHFTDIVFGSFLLHAHDCIEIMLILDGDVELAIEGQRYQLPKGSLVIIPQQLVHQTIVPHGTKRYDRMVLHIFPEYVKLISTWLPSGYVHWDFIKHVSIIDYSPDTFWIFRILFERALYANRKAQEYRKPVIPSLVIELFAEVEQLLKGKASPAIPATNNLVSAVIDYIDEHFMEPGLTVEQIRKSVYISHGYLSRIFKSCTGSSIYSFLTYKRLIRAKERLVLGDTVLDACFACGFTDYTSFLKTFKRAFQMTPTQYRKNHLKLLTIPPPEAQSSL